MEKSYFEKKERKNKIIRVAIILPIGLFFLNYFVGFRLGWFFGFLGWMGIPFVVVLDALLLWAVWMHLEIKLPKKEKPAWLEEELSNLEDIYDRHVRAEERRLEEAVRGHDEICPKCHNSNPGKIVNRVNETKGEVDGDFILGSGSIDGETETKEVNHCNVCGNEWKKEEMEWDAPRKNAMNEILSGIYLFFDTGENLRMDKLKDFHAKAIKIFVRENQYGFRAEKIKKLSKSDLRKYGCK